jgi:DNA-binding transcriptional LysR family regulator
MPFRHDGTPMELRHLRYFLAVAEALNFTKAATQLRIAQPALSRQIQDLEDEIGVDLLRRSPRGVTLTAEGKLFLEEVRDILKRADESVEKVRALARGEYGELHVGYAPSPSSEILPPALAAFQKDAPRVRVVLHDLASQELIAGLLDGSLDIAITVEQMDEPTAGIEFEELCRYPFCAAMAPRHPLARRKSLSLEDIVSQPLIGLHRRDYSEYYRILDRMFASMKVRPRVAVECDGSSSLLTELEAGSGIAIVTNLFRHVAGKRLVFRPLSNSTECLSIGIARAEKADISPAGTKFCEMLRAVSSKLK